MIVSVWIRGRRFGWVDRVEKREKACCGSDMWMSRYNSGIMKSLQDELSRRNSDIRKIH